MLRALNVEYCERHKQLRYNTVWPLARKCDRTDSVSLGLTACMQDHKCLHCFSPYQRQNARAKPPVARTRPGGNLHLGVSSGERKEGT